MVFNCIIYYTYIYIIILLYYIIYYTHTYTYIYYSILYYYYCILYSSSIPFPSLLLLILLLFQFFCSVPFPSVLFLSPIPYTIPNLLHLSHILFFPYTIPPYLSSTQPSFLSFQPSLPLQSSHSFYTCREFVILNCILLCLERIGCWLLTLGVLSWCLCFGGYPELESVFYVWSVWKVVHLMFDVWCMLYYILYYTLLSSVLTSPFQYPLSPILILLKEYICLGFKEIHI